ncbi:hypothetical protein HDU98_005131 [Podochytrium sp. JEL0797]|nr:hypothetical protein HDU98_005131 [Podochytrium sp. JEL0797]
MTSLSAAYFFSTWAFHMEEWATALLLSQVYPNSLFEISLYSFVLTATSIAAGPYIGAIAVSSTRPRLVTLRSCITLQKFFISLILLLLWAMYRHGEDDAWKSFLFGLVMVSGCTLRQINRATSISVEKDWAVVICLWEQIPFTTMNTRIRRVDLFCKFSAPLFISWVLIPLSIQQTILFVLAVALMSIPIQLYLIKNLYDNCSGLVWTDPPAGAVSLVPSERRPHQTPQSLPRKWSLYVNHPMFLSSLAVSFLYLTTLAFGNVMITYFLHLSYSPAFLASMRSTSVLAGLTATFTVSFLIQRLGLVKCGLVSIWFQFFCLLPALYSFSIPDQPMLQTVLFFSGITLSRLGLWNFDICHMELVQTYVTGEVDVGVFNGCEFSVQNGFELLSYLVTMLWNRPEEFWISACVSVGSIFAAAVCFSVFASGEGVDGMRRVQEEIEETCERSPLL